MSQSPREEVRDDADDSIEADAEVMGFGPSVLRPPGSTLNFVSFTPTVKVEGKGTIRSTDTTQHTQGGGTAPAPTTSQSTKPSR